VSTPIARRARPRLPAMRVALGLVTGLVLVASAGAGNAARTPFSYGVTAGEVTSTSAILWTRAPKPGRVTLLVTSQGGRTITRVVNAVTANDLTVQVRVAGLRPGTRHTYCFSTVTKESCSSLSTAPRATADASVRFAVSGDADATHGLDGAPAFNRFQVYGRMAAERNDFNINLGDTIYSDSEVANAPVARTVPQKWLKYRLGLALTGLQRLRASAPLYSHWDDHEFVNDFSQPEHGEEIFRAGVKAFRDYSPVAYSSQLGLYRSVRWGKNLELFFLDERSFRSAKATQACGRDLAPTAPQSVRRAFATLAPSLTSPVSAECTAALTDPTRTMLGARQYAAFTRAIRASSATWKVIVNEVPIQQYYALPYDRWEGYAAEREKLLRFLQADVKNVAFLTTDSHANFVNEVRYRTLGGQPESSGIWEVVTGPVATNTFAKEIDQFLGAKGSGTAIAALFFKPQPPQGVGMQCAAIDVYSYAQVTVTARRLTVAMKDAQGKPVREATGVACAPLVLMAR
jgi:alkaline phosphatase D